MIKLIQYVFVENLPKLESDTSEVISYESSYEIMYEVSSEI